jgi:squalene-associated FAD-dependent desaturase
MRLVGIDPSRALLRLPLQMRYPNHCGGMDFLAPRLPAPFHLLAAVVRAKGLTVADKLSLARFSSAARWMDWGLDIDCSVTQLLERFEQTDRLIQLMWRPLCIAALNTPPERASARVFLRVLGDSLGAARSASDMLLPAEDLSALFPEAAIAHLEKHHGKTLNGVRVRTIQTEGSRWRILGDAVNELHDRVIVATSAASAQSLLSPLDPELAERLTFDYEAIATCYLQYDPAFRLDQAFFALRDEPASAHWGQFVFDRGWVDSTQAGILAVVISAASEAIAIDKETLTTLIARQLSEVFHDESLASPQWTQLIIEKRATFACTPDLQRPANETALHHLWLAGDYTEGPYPSTIESAVSSGLKAAALVVRSFS